jgi:hypothetical protein
VTVPHVPGANDAEPSAGSARTWRIAEAFGAFVAYLALSILFYGRDLIFNLTKLNAGNRYGPQIYVWCFEWWPFAIAHRLSAFHPRVMWAPEGMDLAWGATSVPLLSVVAVPLTMRFGPVVSSNLANLVMPALTALSAFVLARRIVGRTWPAMLAGFIYGFSAYMAGHQSGGHLNLTAAFMVPVVVYLAILRLDEEIRRTGFVVALAATLVCQFLIGQEIFATIVMFGAIALLVAYLTISGSKDRIRDLATLCALALGASAVALAPYLYRVVVASGFSSHPVWNTTPQATDLFELLIPTNTLMLGLFAPLAAIGGRYSHGPVETGAYLGVPMLVVVIWFFKSRWHRDDVRFLAIMLAIVYVASYGSRLHIAGHELFGMPWKLVSRMPLIDSAFPARFSVYVYLIVALIASIWIAEWRAHRGLKAAAVTLIVIFTIPNLHGSRWVHELDTPEFFRSGAYRNQLAPGETILVLPYGESGNSMYWQAETAMYFAMAEGHFPAPRSFLAWPIVGSFIDGGRIPDESEQLNAFLATHGVTAVLFRQDNPSAASWRAMLESSGAKLQAIDDVVLARPDPAALARLRGANALEMECRLDDARFAALLSAADRYLANNPSATDLSPFRAQQLGLLPPGWVRNDGSGFSSEGLWLAPRKKDGVSVGVRASYACVQGLVARYGGEAAETYFPYPRALESAPTGDPFQRKFVMVFTRDALARAVARARTVPAAPPGH